MIHLLFDTERCEPVSSEKEWGRVTAWGQSVNAPELQKLLLTSRSDDLPALTEQIASARLKFAPGPDVDRIVVKALAVLESEEASAVIVTDGKDDNAPAVLMKAVQSLAEQQAATAQANALMQKAMMDYMQRASESVAAYQAASTAQTVQTAQLLSGLQTMFGGALEKMTEFAGRELPADSELYHKGTLDSVKQGIVDGLAKVQISTQNNVAPAVVKMADARPLVVPELQTLVRLVESLATAQIAMVQAIQDFTRARKPAVQSIEMEKDKNGKWCARVKSE